MGVLLVGCCWVFCWVVVLLLLLVVVVVMVVMVVSLVAAMVGCDECELVRPDSERSRLLCV
jgi:hypothetical protein